MSLEERVCKGAAAVSDSYVAESQVPFEFTAELERYEKNVARKLLTRVVSIGDRQVRSSVPLLSWAPDGLSPEEMFDWCWLRMARPPRQGRGRELRIADLFSGCGQMTVGASEAARAVGLKATSALALDIDATSTDTYKLNFPSADVLRGDICTVLDGEPGDQLTETERALIDRVGEVDLLMGGPPCQGHSDLNNHTRRADPRNVLAMRMLRFAEVFKPRHVIVENVRGIVHDRSNVLAEVENGLRRLGYATASEVLKAEQIGVPQTRQRRFLVATRVSKSALATLFSTGHLPVRSFAWACKDLLSASSETVLDEPPKPTIENQRRIQFLAEHDLYDLPDKQRPQCHSGGGHSYKSVYGRLRWDRPSQTITTGFRCAGQGRYVHPDPKACRTITAHEAARLQFIPDYFRFGNVASTALARLIGNAVPPKMIYHVVLRLLVADADFSTD